MRKITLLAVAALISSVSFAQNLSSKLAIRPVISKMALIQKSRTAQTAQSFVATTGVKMDNKAGSIITEATGDTTIIYDVASRLYIRSRDSIMADTYDGLYGEMTINRATKDVYLRDIVTRLGVGTYVKGTLSVDEDTVITIPNNQEVYKTSAGNTYIVSLAKLNGNKIASIDSTTASYQLICENGIFYSATKDMALVLRIGAKVYAGNVGYTYTPLGDAPWGEDQNTYYGVEFKDYTLKYTNTEGTAVNSNVQVGTFQIKYTNGTQNYYVFKNTVDDPATSYIYGFENTDTVALPADQFFGCSSSNNIFYFKPALLASNGTSHYSTSYLLLKHAADGTFSILDPSFYNSSSVTFTSGGLFVNWYNMGWVEYYSNHVWTVVAGINNAVSDNKNVKSTSYFDLSGRSVETPANGLFIKKVTYTDGSVKSVKVMK